MTAPLPVLAENTGSAPEPHWTERPFAAIDFETTAPDPVNGRAVSCAFMVQTPDGQVLDSYATVINAGVKCPADAIAIHGITNERIVAEGIRPKEAVRELRRRLIRCNARHIPLVIMYAAFDWPLLHQEAKRAQLDIPPLPLLDPFVIDKQLWKFRKGKRKLANLCETYGVAIGACHDALADCAMAIGVMRAMVHRFDELRGCSLAELQILQRNWFADQTESLNAYWYKVGDPKAGTATGRWPWGDLQKEASA